MADPLQPLIQALKCLPGVGQKNAERMAYHLLARNSGQARRLGETLIDTVAQVQHCKRCRTLCLQEICSICQDDQRDSSILCVVESALNIRAIEQTGQFNGRYFVLQGRLSPLDGLGPDELGLDLLEHYVQQEPIKEVILATSSTVEGEATAYTIVELLQGGCKLTRLAHGVPLGGELEFVNHTTLSHAFELRREL